MCLLASAAGRSAASIARVTGLSRNGITQIRRRWRKHRLASLSDRPRSGRPVRVTPEYHRPLRAAFRSPRALGYAFTLWSIARFWPMTGLISNSHMDADWVRVWAPATTPATSTAPAK